MFRVIRKQWNSFTNSCKAFGEAIKENNEVIRKEGFLGKGRSDYNWYPSNWENIQNDPHCEDYKNLFVKLRFDGHYHSNHDFEVIRRFESRYKSDENLRKKIARYLEITEENYKPINGKNWRNPLGELKGIGPKILGLHIACAYQDTELGKEYKRLEFELKEIFNKI